MVRVISRGVQLFSTVGSLVGLWLVSGQPSVAVGGVWLDAECYCEDGEGGGDDGVDVFFGHGGVSFCFFWGFEFELGLWAVLIV